MPAIARKLEDNPRTRLNAAIKRASKRARSSMRKLDRDQAEQLRGIYQRAVDDLSSQLAIRAGDSNTLRLEVMGDLLAQAQARMDSLSAERDNALGTGLRTAATLGTEPFALNAALNLNLTRVADEAVRFVAQFVAEDGLQLSDRLWRIDQHGRDVVRDAIQRHIIQGHGASQAAQDFINRGEAVPAPLRDKINQANPGRIGRVIATDLMTGKGTPYDNALRLMRTEINRAHGEAYQAAAFEDEDVIGTRFLLSPNHPEVDICDMHARVNRYGLGPGVYPKGKNPWPAHPNTLSFVEVVYADEVSDEDRQVKQKPTDWLKQQSPGTQVGVLGVRKSWALRRGLLPDNAVTSPWRVVKRKLERDGVALPEIPGMIQIINLPDSSPRTVRPVSAALEATGYKKLATHVLEVIDRTHSDGSLPKIPIRRTSARGYAGAYTHTAITDHPVDIAISSHYKAHREHTLSHEIGHFIDHKGLPGDWMASEKHSALEKWRKAVAATPEVKGLQDLHDGPSHVDIGGRSVPLPKSHLGYLLRKREIWARSYAQWLAQKSGDQVLMRQLRGILDEEAGYAINMHSQWSPANFEPVAEAIDELFKSMGRL